MGRFGGFAFSCSIFSCEIVELTLFFFFFAPLFCWFQISSDAKDAGEGEQAAAKIFRLTDEPLNIDPLSEEGAKPGEVQGALEFKNIFFAYPSRPNMQVRRALQLCGRAPGSYTLRIVLFLHRSGRLVSCRCMRAFMPKIYIPAGVSRVCSSPHSRIALCAASHCFHSFPNFFSADV